MDLYLEVNMKGLEKKKFTIEKVLMQSTPYTRPLGNKTRDYRRYYPYLHGSKTKP